MFGQNQVPDRSLQKTVNQRLERTGTGAQSKVTATVQQGTVTLSGALQYENQRRPILKAVGNIAGVRRVVDQLKSPPKRRPQS